MTPGARAEAAIGLLAAIEAGKAPADDLVAEYFRRHRFAGAKDRAAISELIYGVLRFRASLDWWLAREVPGVEPSARIRVLAALLLIEERSAAQIARDWDGDRFRPARLDAAERRFAEAAEGKPLADRAMPASVRGNYPAWLEPALEASLGRDLAREMAAQLEPAALDLRVNTIKSEREAVRAALAREGIEAARTKLSPLGLRLFARVPLGKLDTFRQGHVEVQDEGSQLASLLVEARPGMRVVDFCAGAGGKTLALAASMGNRGHLVACDISARRLERATERVRRSGASIVQRRVLSSAHDPWVKRHAAGFDRVLVDAPCTGTGTWRRNPDAKWRLKPEDLAELTALQADILASACRLVRPGGRLIYVTCSLLADENEEQVARFLAAHADFGLLPISSVWGEAVGGTAPTRAEMLRLSPARHGTDGFFVAVMERAPLATNPPAADDAP
ncbi:MAG TPA: RsmB/NOP family class I SAM-dependent RNA methyltransferase [Stellaceae bacterium]|nr:RsmB/NOP family class I SAM-dependent RNA methyltransferase [Stellaceae bacterium]